MSDTDACARCGGDCSMTTCPQCDGCENTGPQPCPACQVPAADTEMPPCDICVSDGDDCSACDGTGDENYDGDGGCLTCGGTGWAIPGHCCLCRGSPYCTCCRTCGQCVGTCQCPVTVQLHDGNTITLGPAAGEDTPSGAL